MSLILLFQFLLPCSRYMTSHHVTIVMCIFIIQKLNQNKISEFKHTMISPLLSLVLPSCIVVPIRDLGDKSVFFSSNMHSLQNFQLPTVFLSNHTGMD